MLVNIYLNVDHVVKSSILIFKLITKIKNYRNSMG